MLLLDQCDPSHRQILDQAAQMHLTARLKNSDENDWQVKKSGDNFFRCYVKKKILPVVISADFIAAGDQLGCIDFT